VERCLFTAQEVVFQKKINRLGSDMNLSQINKFKTKDEGKFFMSRFFMKDRVVSIEETKDFFKRIFFIFFKGDFEKNKF